jgi:hypothetical protein
LSAGGRPGGGYYFIPRPRGLRSPLEEATEHEQAASLARFLDERTQDRLKRSVRITAIALNLHAPGLMDKLMEEWAELKEKPQVLIDARDEYRRPGDELNRKLADGSPIH